MKEETAYFVIQGNEDGDVYVTRETEASLLKQLNPDKHGDVELVAADVLESLPPTINMKNWNPFVLIIKGELVVPEAVKVITQFEI